MCINSFNTEAMEAREAQMVVKQEKRILNFDEFCNAVEAMVFEYLICDGFKQSITERKPTTVGK